jgi:hypothetical protein
MGYNMTVLCFLALLTHSESFLADANNTASHSQQLPPVETFLLEPMELENIRIWVPAAKTGPLINRSCRPMTDCLYSCVLPATVHHTKTEPCPADLARLLAEYTAHYYEQTLPLTIFDGWRWEFSYSLCQYDSGTYDLPERGGCWENCWEAILTQSTGSADSQWVQIFPSGEFAVNKSNQKSSIEVKAFDCMRTRDGYPKKRKL